MSDYVLFNNKDNTHDNRRLRGSGASGASGASGGSGGSGGLGGWADNSAFNRLDNYSTYGKHEKLQEREINRNSEGIKENYKLYTTENIIKINNNNNNNNNNSINSNSMTGTSINGNDSFVAGEVVYQTIVIPFYICLMDIIIFNDLFIEVVDNSSIETKNNVLISGKIRKYRLNGAMKNYDIFIEMENEDVFHVKKRGIMMRVRLSEELEVLGGLGGLGVLLLRCQLIHGIVVLAVVAVVVVAVEAVEAEFSHVSVVLNLDTTNMIINIHKYYLL
jgi:hypothetical protein